MTVVTTQNKTQN